MSIKPKEYVLLDISKQNTIRIENDLEIRYGRSGHCVGSLWFIISFDEKKVLFTGDYCEDSEVYICDILRDTCVDMAKSIGKGFNKKENCIYYLKHTLEIEKEKIINFNEALKEEHKKKEEIYKDILQHFIQINESMKNLNHGNEQAVNDVIDIVKTVDTVGSYVENLKKSLSEVSDAVKGYNKINQSVIDISTETNLLSLNASIEAARSGDAGKGFGVIAEKVGELAQTTKETVESGSNQINIINPAIETLYLNISNVLNEIENYALS